MKTKETFNEVIKSMFQQHKIDVQSGLFTHDQATQHITDDYEGFYEWLIEKNPLKTNNKKQNNKKQKTLIIITTIIIIIGLIATAIGYFIM
jgi:hypothetical protein